jgi:hypothetical protein
MASNGLEEEEEKRGGEKRKEENKRPSESGICLGAGYKEQNGPLKKGPSWVLGAAQATRAGWPGQPG